MRIAVLGSGAGGCSVAFDFAAHGHEVQLFDFEEYSEAVARIRGSGGIQAEGALEGFCPIQSAGHDIERSLDEADIIFAVGPAYSTKPFAEACRPHLKKGQTVIVCPGSSGGAIEFKKEAGLELEDDEIQVAETSTLPYAVRSIEPGKVRIFLKLRGGLFLAALPAKNTARVLDAIRDVYPHMAAAKNVLQTSLQNGNPVIHPAVTLLNAALIERTAGDFLFYEDGVTPAVGRLIEAVDLERISIGRALGVDILPDPGIGPTPGLHGGALVRSRLLSGARFQGHQSSNQVGLPLLQRGCGLRTGIHEPTWRSGRCGNSAYVGARKAGLHHDESRLSGRGPADHGVLGDFRIYGRAAGESSGIGLNRSKRLSWSSRS